MSCEEVFSLRILHCEINILFGGGEREGLFNGTISLQEHGLCVCVCARDLADGFIGKSMKRAVFRAVDRPRSASLRSRKNPSPKPRQRLRSSKEAATNSRDGDLCARGHRPRGPYTRTSR